MNSRLPGSLTRRDFLRQATAGAAVAVSLPWLQSCAEEIPPGLRVPYDRLPDGARVVVMYETLPVEITRRGDTFVARSLICTHQGCQVQWKDDDGRYHCPCHDGVFDADGQPLLGPPRHALREFPVTRHEDFVNVDTTAPAEAR